MLKVGITGGIGSGKSTICRIFQSIGIPVYYADDKAKYLMKTDANLISKIKDLLGNDVYDNENNLNTKRIAEIVFNDKEKLKQLNSIVHPAVGIDANNWQKEMEKQGYHYTLKEAALLFESGSYKQLDKIIVVDAPEKLRIQRVMKRDQVSEHEVYNRIKNQWPQDKKNKLADFIINNDGEESIIDQVVLINKELRKLSSL